MNTHLWKDPEATPAVGASRGARRSMGRALMLAIMASMTPAAGVVAQETSPEPAPPAVTEAPPEKIEPGRPITDGSSLSDRLEQSGGVIAPPATEGAAPSVIPAPDVGTTPVIPPPGTEGGAPGPDPR